MNRRLPSSFALTLAVAATPLAAVARPAVPMTHPSPAGRLKFDTRKFMPESELRPGMKGYALTVFKGTKIERFGVEILGVVSKMNNGQDFILFRATSGPPVTRGLNIASGMSGSPVYIGGRLVGAISASIPFSKDPIGLVTPIKDMFDAWSPDLPAKPSSISATLAGDASSGDQRATRPSGLGANFQNYQALDLPLTVSGFNAQGLRRLQDTLAPFRVNVMAGGGVGPRTASEAALSRGAKLVPGAAVGVSLVQGDMDFTATGTVTYRDANRILIFGHPFFGLGPIDAALTTAYVVDVNPSYQNSIKLGAPIKTVGRIFQDRPYSVGGLIGSQPQMIPVHIAINDQSIKRHKDFNLRVLNHPLLTGQLMTQMAGQAISQVHGLPGDSVANVTMDADIEEIGHVRRTNTFYDAVSIDQSAVDDLDSLMRLLSANPFYPLSLKKLTMDVTIQNRHDTAEVDHIFLKQGKYEPGDTVSVGVVLKPYKRQPITQTVSVKIPANTPSGTLTLTVKGGGSGGGGLSLGGGIVLLRPSDPLPPAGNVRQLVKQFVEKPRNNELVTRLILPTTAININGEKLTALPPTLAGVMQATRTSGLKTERDEVKVVQSTPYIVSGTQSLTITVQKKNVNETPSTTTTTTTTTVTAPSSGTDSTTTPDITPGDDSTDSSMDDSVTAPAFTPTDFTATPSNGSTPTALAAPGVTVAALTKAPAATGTPASPSPPSTTAPSTSAPSIKTVGRLASVWRQGSMADFTAGTLKNVSVTSVGDVRLSAALQKLGDTGESYLWSLLPDGQGHVYAGTGDHGLVLKIDSAGKATTFFSTGQLEVTSLARDGTGNLYAGTAPHGIVYKITPDGKGAPFFTVPEKYVTALAYDESRSRLYAAVGGGTGRIYAVPAGGAGTGAAQPWFTSPETHLLALALDKDGNVYAGTSPDGIVYKITPDGSGHVFYDAPDQSIASLAVDSSGNVYAGTTGKGNIYRIRPDGMGKLLSDRSTGSALNLAMDGGDNLYACAGNTVYRISPDETVQTFTTTNDEQFVSLASDRTTGQVYAGTGTVGSLYAIGASGDLQGQFTSTVHDAGLTAHWGTLSWTADTPPGTQVTLQTRSGDVARPDDSWSAWSPSYTTPSGQKVTSPPARYLQYQAVLTGTGAAITQGDVPKLRAVSVYYLPRNQAPTVKMVSPAEGDALSKSATIRWTASDPDKDTLTYDVYYSSDGGKTWTLIKKKSKPTATPAKAKPATPAPKGPVTDQEIAQEVQRMMATLPPSIPAAARQQLLAQAPAVARRSLMMQRAMASSTATATANPNASDLKDLSYTWDTTDVPDGTYQIQVVASDKTSNPQDAQTAKATSATFVVTNAMPTLTILPASVGPNKIVTLHGTVKTGLAFVKAVQARVDNGDPIAAAADDGLFDSPLESFTLTTSPLTNGAHTVEVQALDQAGNTATAKLNVTVR